MAEIVYRNARDTERVETRLEKERADRLALENQILRADVLSTPDVISEMEKGFAQIRAIILRSTLEKADQDDIFKTLSSIKKNALLQVPRTRRSVRPKGLIQ